MEINSAYKTSGWTITSWIYFSAIGDNQLIAYLFLWCFFNLIIIFQINVQIHPRLLNLELNILLVYKKE